MLKENAIRPLAVCIVKHEGKILAGNGFDSVKEEVFYRLLGGGIKFGERAEAALKREFQEELGTGLENVKFITTLETIFTYEGKNGHEILMVFEGDLVNTDLYEKSEIQILDSNEGGVASWQKIDDCKNGKVILYPEGILDFI